MRYDAPGGIGFADWVSFGRLMRLLEPLRRGRLDIFTQSSFKVRCKPTKVSVSEDLNLPRWVN